LRPTEPPTLYPLAFAEDPDAKPIEADTLESFADKAPHKGPFVRSAITLRLIALENNSRGHCRNVLKAIQESDQHNHLCAPLSLITGRTAGAGQRFDGKN